MKFMPKLGAIIAAFIAIIAAFIYGLTAVMACIGALIPASVNKPADLNDYKIADSLHEYFNYLGTQKRVGIGSDVHLVIPVQLALKDLGYNLGPCSTDGQAGEYFAVAVGKFQYAHGLEATGTADSETLQALFKEALSRDDVAKQLEAELITPYHTEAARKFMDALPDLFAYYAGWDLLLRPDMLIYGGIAGLTLNRFGGNAAEMYFKGCVNNNQRDSFRHSNAVAWISDFPTGSAEWAVEILDIRERSGDNPQPIRLMDMFNHRLAANLLEETRARGERIPDYNKFLAEAIEKGQFITYPLPLVPKKADSRQESMIH